VPEVAQVKDVPTPGPVTQVTTPAVQPVKSTTVSWGQAIQVLSGLASREITVSESSPRLQWARMPCPFRSRRAGRLCLSASAGYNRRQTVPDFSERLGSRQPNCCRRTDAFPEEIGISLQMPRRWEVLVIVADNKRDFASLGLMAHDDITSAPLKELEQALTRLGGQSCRGARVPEGRGPLCCRFWRCALQGDRSRESTKNALRIPA
jgi:hypothetical protein